MFGCTPSEWHRQGSLKNWANVAQAVLGPHVLAPVVLRPGHAALRPHNATLRAKP